MKNLRLMRSKILFSILLTAAVILAIVPCASLSANGTEPTMEIFPDEGPVGTKLYVTLHNFKPIETVEICFGATDIHIPKCECSGKTDESGYLHIAFEVRKYPAGNYKVIASDGENEKYAYFTIEPQVTINKTDGYVGDQIAVSGTGFAANKEVAIYFEREKIGSGKTNENGTFTGVSCKIPESPKGRHTIKAEDAKDNYDTIDFITRQSITINPTSGPVGTKVSIKGTGFEANEDVITTFDNEEVASNPTDKNGSFAGVFITPSRIKGNYRIKASDGTNLDYADFTILIGTNLNLTTGHVGTTLTVSGSGFVINEKVTIKYDTAEIATTTADAKGAFLVSFNAPPSKHGEHTVTATDGVNAIKMPFTMESTPPATPAPLSPEDNYEASVQPYFDWEDVQDVSGVTYTLQIASDPDFAEPVLTKRGLIDSEYIITEEEKLARTKKEMSYYWRVRAIDGASNASEWSTSRSFYVGFSFDMPPWTKYSLIGLGIALLSFLCFWAGRSIFYHVSYSSQNLRRQTGGDQAVGYKS